MGLTLRISEKVKEYYNADGKTVREYIELDDLSGCWSVKEALDDRQFIANCTTVSYHEGVFFGVLKELEENGATSSEINKLKGFIEENKLKYQKPTKEDEEYGTSECYGRIFDVFAWW